MAIQFRCERCGQLISIGSRMAGATVPCPTCATNLVVPPESSDVVPIEPDAAPAWFAGRHAHAAPLDAAPANAAPDAVESLGDDFVTVDEAPIEPEIPAIDFSDSELAVPPVALERVSSGEDDERGFRVRSRAPESDDLDLTPMVDVTFLLLIFFMITASFSLQKSLEVPPPNPENRGARQSLDELDELLAESIRVEIDARNRIVVDDEAVADVDRLADTLRERMRSDRRRELFVTADDASLHDTVIRVVDAAQEAGVQRIRMASRGSSGDDGP